MGGVGGFTMNPNEKYFLRGGGGGGGGIKI